MTGISLGAPSIIRLEERHLGQLSLEWARRGSRVLTELLHFFYAGYYAYTPVLAIYLYSKACYQEFEAMALAVNLGYAVSYTLFALIPVWGPRWALSSEGRLSASEQQLRGYWITKGINYIMYQGIAHKGGAMPSAHSSTAAVFLLWSWRLWDLPGGIPATLLVVGMAVASLYGRYHYLSDILCGGPAGAGQCVDCGSACSPLIGPGRCRFHGN